MYAVISTGGKQYRLEPGDLIRVESLEGAVGDRIVFGEVLALGDDKSAQFGTPLVDGAHVIGTIVEQGKAAKVGVLKFKRRKMYRKRSGHRQHFSSVKINSIESGHEVEAQAEKKSTTRERKPAETKVVRTAPKKITETVKKEVVEPKKAKPAAKKPAAKGRKPTAAGAAKKTARTPASKPKSKSKKSQD